METVHGELPPVNTDDNDLSPHACCHQCDPIAAAQARRAHLQKRWFDARDELMRIQVGGDVEAIARAKWQLTERMGELTRYQQAWTDWVRTCLRWMAVTEEPECPFRSLADQVGALEAGRDDHADRLGTLESVLAEAVVQ